MGLALKVECYSGRKADERPLRFSMGAPLKAAETGAAPRVYEVKDNDTSSFDEAMKIIRSWNYNGGEIPIPLGKFYQVDAPRFDQVVVVGRQGMARLARGELPARAARVPGEMMLSAAAERRWGEFYLQEAERRRFGIVDARRKKLLKRFVATPMSRAQYLMSFLVMRLALLVIEATVITLFGCKRRMPLQSSRSSATG